VIAPAKKKEDLKMNESQVEKFEKVNAQLLGIYEELSALSKKSPNDGVNKFKLRFINQVLSEANSFLDVKHTPFPDFTIFIEEELPSNSDVVFVLSQYLKCLETLRAENIGRSDFDIHWYWVMDGKTSNIVTAPPEKVKGK
jgi:hypothetical protein